MLEYLTANPQVVPVVGIVAVLIVGALILMVISLTTASKNNQEHEKTTRDIALEVLAGLWGNGEDRKRRLTAAGYDPAEVQAAVNELLERRDE